MKNRRSPAIISLFIYDPAANQGDHDGAGIDTVNIKIYYNGTLVHERTERVSGYCAFGGGEPDCNVFSLKDNSQWPETHQPISNGRHTVAIFITTKSENTANWDWEFYIQR